MGLKMSTFDCFLAKYIPKIVTVNTKGNNTGVNKTSDQIFEAQTNSTKTQISLAKQKY